MLLKYHGKNQKLKIKNKIEKTKEFIYVQSFFSIFLSKKKNLNYKSKIVVDLPWTSQLCWLFNGAQRAHVICL